jgi:hypothetical protein
MARSTLHGQVQRCPACGYCAVEADDFDERFRAVIESESYREHLNAADYPKLASSFICAGMLFEAIGQQGEAGWAYLKAAWVLDDHKKDRLARHWRSRAAEQFLAAIGRDELLGDQAGAIEAVVADCLRRAKQFAKALKVIRYAERGECEPVIRKVLAFERVLIQRSDTACHTVAEALEYDSNTDSD